VKLAGTEAAPAREAALAGSAGACDASLLNPVPQSAACPADLVASVFRSPEQVSGFDEAAWDLLVRQARRANLLARLAWVLRQRGLWDGVLPAARPHLESAWVFAERQRIAVQWEIDCIGRALHSTGVTLLLLKGAAYSAAGLPPAAGRLVSDLDILVPKGRIAEVESQLMINGWNTIHHDAYDQRYYRRWMHEIPPMRHLKRGTVIDVHHALLPETARIRADTDQMRSAAVDVPGAGVQVLAPADMVLHSATHLFHEGELDNGLRDLVDLDSLLRHFGAQPGFWDRLVPRAVEVGLARPLYYALRYTKLKLGTPVPDGVAAAAAAAAGPAGPLRVLMDALFVRALRPKHPSCSGAATRLARWLLYVRGHWLRMPVPLLLYHLTRKAVVRPDDAEPRGPKPQA